MLPSNRNSIVSIETNLNLHKDYSLDGRSCPDHLPYVIQLDSTIAKVNPPNTPVFSFSNVDWEIVDSAFREHSFIGYCYSNVDVLCTTLDDWMKETLSLCVSKRTRHRKALPPWVTPETSNLMKRLENERKIFDKNPSLSHAIKVQQREFLLNEALVVDQAIYEHNLVSDRKFSAIHKYCVQKRSKAMSHTAHSVQWPTKGVNRLE